MNVRTNHSHAFVARTIAKEAFKDYLIAMHNNDDSFAKLVFIVTGKRCDWWIGAKYELMDNEKLSRGFVIPFDKNIDREEIFEQTIFEILQKQNAY